MQKENGSHAFLSASGSSKWINCPPSARLEQNFKETSSVYTQEGTLAHEIVELKTKKLLNLISKKVFNIEFNSIKKKHLYSTEMDFETDKYIECIKTIYEEALKTNKNTEFLIEQRLDFSHIVKNGYGTVDFLFLSENTINIVDFKYGRGVKISAKDNTQLMLYAVGAVRKYELLYDLKTIKLVIIQPRLNNLSTHELKVDHLIHWAENIIKPKALKAYKGEGKQVVGDWCRFCKAKPVCRAIHELSIDTAKYEFRDPNILSDPEILEVSKKIEILLDWITSVKKYMLEKALEGKEWEGYKLVEGRSNRRWSNEEKVKEILKSKYQEKDFISEKIKSIAYIENLLKDDKLKDKVNKYIIKPEGTPALVDLSDKRKPLKIEQAKKDFAD